MGDRRKEHSRQTRHEILVAARRLFAAAGYGPTTMAEIAGAVGVSVQTIYDRVGTKAALAQQLIDLIDETAGVAELASGIPTCEDPAALLSLPARITRRILETNGDIARIVFSGANQEPAIEKMRREGMQRHRSGMRMIVDRLQAIGALGPGDPERLADTVAILAQPETWLVLLDDYGWSLDEVHAWTVESTTRLAGATQTDRTEEGRR